MKDIAFGDITTVTSGIIVHGCNAQGVMGSGVAKMVRAKYPFAYESYADHIALCQTSKFDPLGTVDFAEINADLVIANAITQKHFGKDGQKYVSYRAIFNVFALVGQYAVDHDLHIHYPTIGAGLGGGDWAIISEIIDNALGQSVHRTLWIYE